MRMVFIKYFILTLGVMLISAARAASDGANSSNDWYAGDEVQISATQAGDGDPKVNTYKKVQFITELKREGTAQTPGDQHGNLGSIDAQRWVCLLYDRCANQGDAPYTTFTAECNYELDIAWSYDLSNPLNSDPAFPKKAAGSGFASEKLKVWPDQGQEPRISPLDDDFDTSAATPKQSPGHKNKTDTMVTSFSNLYLDDATSYIVWAEAILHVSSEVRNLNGCLAKVTSTAETKFLALYLSNNN